MPIAVIGLALAAYASLLNERNGIRYVFAVMSFITLMWSMTQSLIVATG